MAFTNTVKVQVSAPKTSGMANSIWKFSSLEDARRFAEETFGDRRDLNYGDVRIESLDGKKIEFAGPAR